MHLRSTCTLQEVAAKLKAEGNDLFRESKFAEAAERYGQAIEADPNEAALFSNRAACYAGLDQWSESLADANSCVLLRPDWAKGYYRRALALSKTGNLLEGRSMCDAGLLLDKDSKELQDLRVQIQDLIKRLISHHQKDLKKKCQTTHACDVDFRMVRYSAALPDNTLAKTASLDACIGSRDFGDD